MIDPRWRPSDELRCICPHHNSTVDPKCEIHGLPPPEMGSEGCVCLGAAEDDGPLRWTYVFDCPHHKHMWTPRQGMTVPNFVQIIPAGDMLLTYWIDSLMVSEQRILCLALLDNGKTDALVWSSRRMAVVPAKVFVDDEMRFNDQGVVLKYEIVEKR